MAKKREVAASLTIGKRIGGGMNKYRVRYWLGARDLAVTDGAAVARFTFPTAIKGMDSGEWVAVDPGYLAKVLKEWGPSDEVSARVEDGQLVAAGVTLPSVDTDGVSEPIWPGVSGERCEFDPGRVLGVSEFRSSDDGRPVLTGVYFTEGGQVVGTDSYRLAVDEAVSGCEFSRGVNIPGNVVGVIAKASPDRFAVTVGSDEGEYLQVLGVDKYGTAMDWRGREIEGQFPNYQQLLPDGHDARAVVEVEKAVSHFEKCARWSERNAPAVLSVNGTVEVSCESQDGPAVAPESITGPVEWTGTRFDRIGGNPEFLLSAVRYLGEDEKVDLRFISPLRPMQLLGDRRRVLVMPIRLNN